MNPDAEPGGRAPRPADLVPLAPGDTIGILGGGQLGRMLAVAAARLGFATHVFDPAPGCPAAQVANACTTADWEDTAALDAFAAAVDVITFEFENIPAEAVERLEARCPVHPNRRALAICQDRADEKTFLNDIGVPTAPWGPVDDQASLGTVAARLGPATILKTRRLGYDGKGQLRFSAMPDDDAFERAGRAASVLEGFVDFSCEVSVIVARGADGSVSAFDPGRNYHADGILRTTSVPCGLPDRMIGDAVLLGARIVTAMEYVGVMGVEMFVTGEGLIVNEIAPRVHNSGHWTQAGTAVDQFEQHIRAIAGLPLGDGQRYADVVMENLIGDDMERLPGLLAERDCQVHLYGKAEVRPGRKMGHVNRITSLIA